MLRLKQDSGGKYDGFLRPGKGGGRVIEKDGVMKERERKNKEKALQGMVYFGRVLLIHL